MDLTAMRQELRRLTMDAVHKGPVTLASGKISDFYIDGRLVSLSAQGLYLTACLMADLLKGVDFDAVGGPTMGADPIVGALLYHFSTADAAQSLRCKADERRGERAYADVRKRAEAEDNTADEVFGRAPLTGFIIRKEAKAHGMQKMIEGPALASGERVVLVEDVVTSGGSVLKAAKAVEEAGAKVVKILALVDREEGAAEALVDAGYDFGAVFTKTELTGV